MMKSQLILALGCAASLASMGSSHASIVAQWTFETSVPTTSGPYMPETGSGSATGFHSGSTTYSNPGGNGSTESYSSTGWSIGDYYQFQVSTIGYTGISLSWHQASSNTGPKDYKLAYSIDGVVYSDFATYTVLANASPNPSWNSSTVHNEYRLAANLVAINNLNNEAKVYFRLIDISATSAEGETVGTGGTDRIDNFTVSGAPITAAVPEPATYLAGALVLLPLGISAIRAQRNRKQTS